MEIISKESQLSSSNTNAQQHTHAAANLSISLERERERERGLDTGGSIRVCHGVAIIFFMLYGRLAGGRAAGFTFASFFLTKRP